MFLELREDALEDDRQTDRFAERRRRLLLAQLIEDLPDPAGPERGEAGLGELVAELAVGLELPLVEELIGGRLLGEGRMVRAYSRRSSLSWKSALMVGLM